MTEVHIVDVDPKRGCHGCGSQRTVLLDSRVGRQCPEHLTFPVGAFRRDLAADLVDAGRPDVAFAYLAACLARTTVDRFAQASVRNASAGCHPSSGTSNGPACNVASPSHMPASVRIRPHSQPVRPSSQATGFGGITRDAVRLDSAARISASSSSDGSGVHTAPTVGAR